MLKKPSRNRDAVDISADDPSKAMEQFTEGLKRVLSASKPRKPKKRQRKR